MSNPPAEKEMVINCFATDTVRIKLKRNILFTVRNVTTVSESVL